MFRRLLKGLVFFIGWLLSPFTWWNDAFVNIPLSYLIANLLFCISGLAFKWLVLGAYWATNVLGLFFMYSGGRYLILSSRKKTKAVISVVVFLVAYSAVMSYLDRHGKLLPLGAFFERHCVVK